MWMRFLGGTRKISYTPIEKAILIPDPFLSDGRLKALGKTIQL